MIKKILKDKLVILCLLILFIIILLGIFAPYITKYNPVEGDIIKKFAKPSAEHWLGTDYYGTYYYNWTCSRLSFRIF